MADATDWVTALSSLVTTTAEALRKPDYTAPAVAASPAVSDPAGYPMPMLEGMDTIVYVAGGIGVLGLVYLATRK